MAQSTNDDMLMEAAAEVGAEYGMSATDLIAHILLGDQRHPDADDDVCGAASPRDSTRWCGREPRHHGDHVPVNPHTRRLV